MKRGRTWRTRKRCACAKVDVCAPFEHTHSELKQWMKIKSNGLLKTCHLGPRDFSNTGRGLKATKAINPGDVIVSVPGTLLMTPFTALDSVVGDVIKQCRPLLTPQGALALFLVYEHHLGSDSEWFPYIQSVPTEFSTPLYFTPDQLCYLTQEIRERAEDMIKRFYEVYNEIVAVLKPFPDSESWFSFDRFRWAWSVVNTRSVYLETPVTPLLQFTPPGENNVALAPFLDLLNHSQDAQMEAGYNDKTGCYEIKTFNKFKKHDQVFICYGYHDNQYLFLEYGFTIPGNIHNVYGFSWDKISDLKTVFKVSYWEKKLSVILENDLNEGLTCTTNGLSWKLHKLLTVLAMTWNELESWKRLFLSEVVSEENEKSVKQMAAWLVKRAMVYYQQFKCPCIEEHIHDRLASSLLQDQLETLQKTLNSLQWTS